MSVKPTDLGGRVYGKLTVLKRVGTNKWGTPNWLCHCECGLEVVVTSSNLLRGNFQSCGCRKGTWTHELSRSDLYSTWRSMHRRCYDRTHNAWHNYGGRGIQVCLRWCKSNIYGLENFIADMGARPSPRHSIDRIDNNGDYEPPNCRWATTKEQHRNRRDNQFHTAFGETKTLSEWIDDPRCKAEYRQALGWRSKHWMNPEDAITKPLRKLRHPAQICKLR